MKSDSTFLESDELQELTGRKQRSSQIRELRYMGIEHRIRRDGSIAVLCDHLANVMGGSSKHSEITSEFSLNMEAINA